MTILQPSTHNGLWSIALVIALAGVVIGVAGAVALYSRVAFVRGEIGRFELRVDGERLRNAELKREIFARTDPKSLEALAAAKGLVKEKNPQWVFATPSPSSR
ncbi:MAG: hypothetical protein HY536_00525 [Candidatus Colwellbacteria bacterium]|nr:hypothetical protein [Candidatus Colwellbacteria bacterium]